MPTPPLVCNTSCRRKGETDSACKRLGKAPLPRVFKIEISKVSGSALAAEICTGPHNRLLRRQHCSSLCSQSEGHEHVANMTNALGHNFVGFSARGWAAQYSPPSLCEQSELQCFAPELRCTLLFSKKRRFFLATNVKNKGLSNTYLILFTYLCNICLTYIKLHIKIIIMAGNTHQTIAHRL